MVFISCSAKNIHSSRLTPSIYGSRVRIDCFISADSCVEAIKAACHNMSMDADYDTFVDNCKIVIDMATRLYELYQQPNSIITEFSKMASRFYLKNHLKK